MNHKTIKPCPTNMVIVRIFFFLGDVFNKTILPVALVGYEIVTANSYSTRARGIIVSYKFDFDAEGPLKENSFNSIGSASHPL